MPSMRGKGGVRLVRYQMVSLELQSSLAGTSRILFDRRKEEKASFCRMLVTQESLLLCRSFHNRGVAEAARKWIRRLPGYC